MENQHISFVEWNVRDDPESGGQVGMTGANSCFEETGHNKRILVIGWGGRGWDRKYGRHTERGCLVMEGHPRVTVKVNNKVPQTGSLKQQTYIFP